MKNIALLALTMIFSSATAQSCVNYNPITNTYTIDPSGYVGPKREKNQKSSNKIHSSKSSKVKKNNR